MKKKYQNVFCKERKFLSLFYTNQTNKVMQKQPATLEEVQALYETVRQLERALEAKHKEFIEQRARASYYKMLFEDAKLKQVQ